MQQKNICLPLCPLLTFPPHLSLSCLFFLALFHPAVFIYFSFTQHLLLRDTLPGEPLICFLWSASVFRDALSIAASLSHQPSVSLDFGSPPKHFFFFLGHHQLCATASSVSLEMLQSVYAGTCKPHRLLSGRSCCSVCALVYASVVWRESLKGPPL